MKAVLTLLAVALGAAALAASGSAAADAPEPFVPFVTDFPVGGHERAPSAVPAASADGFDGLDAAVGAAAGLAVGALAAASLPATRRRRSVSSA